MTCSGAGATEVGGCPDRCYLGVSVLAIVTFVIKKVLLISTRAIDIRLIALIAVPVLGYISTEFQLKTNADILYHASVKCIKSVQTWCAAKKLYKIPACCIPTET